MLNVINLHSIKAHHPDTNKTCIDTYLQNTCMRVYMRICSSVKSG